MLYRYAEAKRIELPVTRESGKFTDANKVSSWAKDAVDGMYKAEVINGKGNNMFDPKGTASRAEVAQMFIIKK